MNGKTHMAIGLAGSSILLLQHTDIRTGMIGLGFAALGSLLVDTDISQSEASSKISDLTEALVLIIGILLFLKYKMNYDAFKVLSNSMPSYAQFIGVALIVGSIIYGRYSGHRFYTHSIFGVITMTMGIYLLFSAFAGWFAVGYILHIVADILNKKSVHLLYPIAPDFGVCLNVCVADGLISKLIRNGSYILFVFSIVTMKG